MRRSDDTPTRFVIRSFVVSLLLFGVLACTAKADSNIFIVRHAEKADGGGNDPDLSQAGRTRADSLARMLKDAGITAIYTTELKRTQQTAAPLAAAISVTPTVVPAKETPALALKLRNLNGTALVVGHGNTIPDLLKALGIDTPVSISEDDYNELFIVTFKDKPSLLRLHYP